MATFEVEYTICLIQRDIFSFAAKSHRQEDGNPQLEVTVEPQRVVWTLSDLDHGVPETVAGTPQVDRVDFYFRREVLQASLPTFPTVAVGPDPSLRLPATNSAGTERPEGTRVRIATPVCRFFPLDSVALTVARPPEFRALADEAYLHLDIETGPASIYGTEIFEVHFGVEADYRAGPLASGNGPSRAVLTMSHELYATVLSEARWAVT